MRIKPAVLITLAFLEGGCVMACELLGAKLIGPYFGASLYVWAAVLGVTLGALMCGYYLGGLLSTIDRGRFVFYVLAVAGLLTAIMPLTAHQVMARLLDWSIQAGSVTALMVFLFPQLMLFGMTSPMIINLLHEDRGAAGKMAGSVYAISTLGGIIATFAMGFYLMPEFGLQWPALAFGGTIIGAAILGALLTRQARHAIIPGLLLGLALLPAGHPAQVFHGDRMVLLHQSDGVLGQVRVVDRPFTTFTRGRSRARILYVNNSAQSIMDLRNPQYSLWDWAYYFPAAASVFEPDSRALLIGLGGGTIVNQFERLGFEQHVVELDARIRDVTLEYFAVDPATPITIDDGRHYLNTTDQTYDLITLDVFLGETPPAHLISLESFRRMKTLLNEGGMVMMNFYGYLNGAAGRPARSIYKTFEAAGFTPRLLVTPGSEQSRNLIFLALTSDKDFSATTYAEPGLPPLGDLSRFFVDPDSLDLANAEVLTDRIPRLERMYQQNALAWREAVNAYATRPFVDAGFH